MYRQRKRDLNLKPNRQLDKRSSRGMIYENEELRMRTIAICEDVDRGQSDIKKLRKENDHLKREIWGLRDECEKLEEILKKVCISANIPEFTLDSDKPKKGQEEEDSEDDDDDDDDEEEEDDASFYGAGGNGDNMKTERQRRESGASVMTFDSEVGSCMTNMFSDDPGGGLGGGQDVGFAVDDPGSVINMNPKCSTSAGTVVATEVICHPHPSSPEPGPSTSFAHSSQPWSHPTAISPDLECVKEETESTISSPISLTLKTQADLDNIVLPDPSLIMLPLEIGGVQENSLVAEGRKTPVIQITPASSPASIENGTETAPQSPTENTPNITTDPDSIHNMGCITVVPKTFKVTSEIVVGDENGESTGGGEQQTISKSEELPRKILKMPPVKQDSDPLPSDHIILNQSSLSGGGFQYPQRRSCHFPTATTTTTAAGVAQTLPPNVSSVHHRSFGMLTGYSCCCANDDSHLIGGYQSEPSLNHVLSTNPADNVPNLLNSFQCCRVSPSAAMSPILTPLAIRSVWNTVDKNIVIGFYGVSGGGIGGIMDSSIEPKVQEIIDELEAQFDPTLENIQGIRLIPGRIFVSLKNGNLVKSFLAQFKNDLVLRRKNSQQRIRIHFIEGATQKLTTTLFLSGIPQELSDLTVISSLNQFGQVVAPLERRNYKGVDISERIAKMHLVVGEDSLPDCINVNGYSVRIRVERHSDSGPPPPMSIGGITPTTKYGFVMPPQTTHDAMHHPTTTTTVTTSSRTNPTTTTVTAAAVPPSTLKPHKPVIRSSSSAPRLETPAPGTLTCPLPSVEQKRQSSVCVENIPPDQHPSRLLEKQQHTTSAVPHHQHKVTIAPPQTSQQSIQGSSTQTLSTPNLQPPLKKPLARLLVSSPGAFGPASPPASGPASPVAGENAGGGGALKNFYRSFDSRKSTGGASASGSHAPLTPSSSYSPRSRRKSSVQFAGNVGRKREPLPWCGCWGLGCGN